jgi:hypothetical protein
LNLGPAAETYRRVQTDGIANGSDCKIPGTPDSRFRGGKRSSQATGAVRIRWPAHIVSAGILRAGSERRVFLTVECSAPPERSMTLAMLARPSPPEIPPPRLGTSRPTVLAL